MAVKKLTTLAFVLFVFTSSLQAIEIIGNYTLQGFDPFTKHEYSGKAFITKRDKTYNARWEIAEGEVYSGTGLLKDNEVSFVFKTANAKEIKYGIQVYKIEGETLTGAWTFIGEDKVGTEVLKKS